MNAIIHHIPDELLIAYANGTLGQAYSLVVAAHVSMCDESRARLGAHQAVGGALLENAGTETVSDRARAAVFDRLDMPVKEAPPIRASGIFPEPVMEALGGLPPRWKPLGLGVRQMILNHDAEGSARLLYIPGGQAVPDHGHNGLELTLVLQGAFRDETGRFGVGDVEVADGDLEHEPIAEEGEACICLAATDAALRFRSLVPRLLQPIFRI
ncbi:Transcriptional activator ChrR [Tritonibacter multivorans]|uniref:Transcriptional activator ChrR n=1 Tax=Tritonibacter multivorans TaxID=928856 RepID=A0A0P1G7S3_9RHOB|nr:ChrR family anti-sigma-E factor [Tritonibacter multivorans]MDA7422348.1 ChrR family anti-sigma-E factor [Tritonibacter multivorans]CUH77703.1 Transcriptional activator ChrR [Tritonibacter multivorans]SFD13850.1 anti-ECFsigma factor, ChrR [Tritonibacter multivorans]